eukprot:jgi/Mesvir1/5834/Mv25157-RA.1
MAMLSMDRLQIPTFVQHSRQTYSSVVTHGTELILSAASETRLFAASSSQVSITGLVSASDVPRSLAVETSFLTVASSPTTDGPSAMVCIGGEEDNRGVNTPKMIDEDSCVSSPLDLSSSSISFTESFVVSPSLRLPPRPPLQGSGGSGSMSSASRREKKVTISHDAVPAAREGLSGDGECASNHHHHHHANGSSSPAMTRAEHDQRAAASAAWAAKKSLRKDCMGSRCKSAVDLHGVDLEAEGDAAASIITELPGGNHHMDFRVREIPIPADIAACHPESQTASTLAHASASSSGGGAHPFPCLRSGKAESIGSKSSMEDVSCLFDDLVKGAGFHAGAMHSPVAFYGVFDGHGGSLAASFCSEHMVRELVSLLNETAPQEAAIQCSSVLAQVFANTDRALQGIVDMDAFCGTTALVALLLGRSLFVANAGDCRAVLSVRGTCLPLTKDHKPSCEMEHQRVRDAGGYIEDGYVNGNLSVTRALGDFHLKEVCVRTGRAGPLICTPEVRHHEGPPVARASTVRRGVFLNSRLKRSWSLESISKLKQAMGCESSPEESSPEESPMGPVSPAPRHRLGTSG